LRDPRLVADGYVPNHKFYTAERAQTRRQQTNRDCLRLFLGWGESTSQFPQKIVMMRDGGKSGFGDELGASPSGIFSGIVNAFSTIRSSMSKSRTKVWSCFWG